MVDKTSDTPILTKYLKLYQEQPNSLTFAPLAEAYRKIGDYEKAFAILKKGLKEHPHYAYGYYILSNCYFDKGEYSLGYTTLKPFAYQYRDNLKFQELFAELCLKLDEDFEALEAFKNILFLSPKNNVIQNKVKLLEESLQILTHENSPASKSKNDESWKFKVKQSVSDESVDSWVQVNLSLSNTENKFSSQVDQDFTLIQPKAQQESQNKKDDDSNSLLITHTLVDLYISQGHHDRAIDVLNKILQLEPNDVRTLKKLEMVKSKVSEDKNENYPEDDGTSQSEIELPSVSTISLEKLHQSLGYFMELINEEKKKKHISY